jgi:hypothetical protein
MGVELDMHMHGQEDTVYDTLSSNAVIRSSHARCVVSFKFISPSLL